jgi:hypothetical protein
MTPSQLHQAHTQGMTEREIDDQIAEDEEFERMERESRTAPLEEQK